MTDYTKLVEALREAKKHMWKQPQIELYPIMDDAAAAIEELQAEVEFYKNLAEERQETADRKERLLGTYRAQNIYSAKDSSGNLITNLCSLNCSEIPNS